MDSKKLQQEFVEWCKTKNKSSKSKEETTLLFHEFMKEKHPKEYEAAMKQQSQEQVKAAAHGAKLNYFKNLKNQCAEDEEVVYYRKGGSVKCGCKKKEQGGEVPTAKTGSAVDKFKARKMSSGGNPPQKDSKQKKELNIKWTNLDDRKLDSLVTRSEIQKKPLTPQGQKDLKALREKFKNSSNKEEYEVEASEQKKCGGKVKKHQSGDEILPIKHPKGQPSKHINRGGTKSKIPVQSCGAKVKKDYNGAVAKFKAKCGSKLKKHLLGGSLNGIPFYLGGTPKGGLPTAPKAEKRFKKNSYNTIKEGNRETTTITSRTFGYNRNWPYLRLPATILRIVEGADTAFVETPEHHIFTNVLPRTALKSGNTYVEYNPKYDKNYSLYGQANTLFNYPTTPLEYEILKRRFNTALNLAK